MKSLTLGIVPYLNVLPLLEGLDNAFPRENWIAATPRELAGLLASREVDVASASTFEGLRSRGRYTLLPGVGIGSDGPVRSVGLFSRVPLGEIRSVLLDRASLTSIHLARILASELLQIDPEYELSPQPVPVDYDWKNGPHDAIVAIGDTALSWEHTFPYRLDLGEGWKRLTGLPFVFAAWWAREGLELGEEEIAAFHTARDRGRENTDALIERVLAEPSVYRWERESLSRYFHHSMCYELGERQLESIDLFRQKLITHGLLDEGTPEVTVWRPELR